MPWYILVLDRKKKKKIGGKKGEGGSMGEKEWLWYQLLCTFSGFVYIFEFLYGNEIGMMNKGLVMRK
jgi:hypothetical protein